MTISAELSVERRQSSTKGELRQLRQSGYVPGVVYGHHVEAVPVQVEAKQLIELLGKVSSSSIIALQLPGTGELLNAMIKDVQYDAVKRTPVHIDWQVVNLDEPVITAIPLHLVGRAPGEASGGVLQLGAREVEVRAKPELLPPRLDVEIGSLDVGDHICVADLHLPEGIELLSNPADVVAGIVAPNLKEEEAPPVEIIIALNESETEQRPGE